MGMEAALGVTRVVDEAHDRGVCIPLGIEDK